MSRQVRCRPGSYQLARSTPTFGLSGTSCAGTPPMKASARAWAPDPIGERLRPGRLGVGVARRAHRRDEHLGRAHLAAPAVDDPDRLAGIVDEQAFARRMRLPHRRRQPPLPGTVELAPAAVGIAIRLGGAVLLPEQHERDAGATQLAMDTGPVRLPLPPETLPGAGAGIEHALEHAVAQRLRQRPGETRRGETLEREGHRAAGDAERSRDRPVARPAGMLQTQDLSYASHRYSLGWHRLPHPSLVRDEQEPADPSSDRATATRRVADFKSGWPTSRRNRWPASSRNRWPTCPGISSSGPRSVFLSSTVGLRLRFPPSLAS